MAAKPGILYVTMQPAATLAVTDFHDWYNNDHGPLRLRLSPSIPNGFRYRATDLAAPGGTGKHEWMAVYDLADVATLNTPAYLALRGSPVQSQRERQVRPQVDIDRRTYELLRTWQAADFTPFEDVRNEGRENVMISVGMTLREGRNADEVERWYNEEHIGLIQKVPGWRRTRRFARSALDGQPSTDYLVLSEYAPDTDFGGPAFTEPARTPWTKEIVTTVIEPPTRRMYKLYYTFSAAPRDLASITAATTAATTTLQPFHNPATGTRATPSSASAPASLESYITTPDGARLPYRLEGNPSPTAPLLVLSNSILVDWSIWDGVVARLLRSHPHLRILRYLTRGRSRHFGSKAITVDVLAADLLVLLDAMRVRSAAAAVGVSLGGATVLAAGLTHPERVPRFLACDTSATSPSGNAATWGARLEMAAAEDMRSSTGGDSGGDETEQPRRIVGTRLAEATARRWFTPASYSGSGRSGSGSDSDSENLAATCAFVEAQVRDNDLAGFAASVQALWAYDYAPLLRGYADAEAGAQGRRGAFLVGAQDGALPGTMATMAGQLGPARGGAELTVVQGAGHLPMVERPEEVARAVARLLEG